MKSNSGSGGKQATERGGPDGSPPDLRDAYRRRVLPALWITAAVAAVAWYAPQLIRSLLGTAPDRGSGSLLVFVWYFAVLAGTVAAVVRIRRCPRCNRGFGVRSFDRCPSCRAQIK